MIAAGAIIKLEGTDKILLNRRHNNDIHEKEWEMVYGRIDQHEDLLDGLKREVLEETGITKLRIVKPLRLWHIYRGGKSADTEVYGMTFICETSQKTAKLSSEHSEYKWASLSEALKLVQVPVIREDLECYQQSLNSENLELYISDINRKLTKF